MQKPFLRGGYFFNNAKERRRHHYLKMFRSLLAAIGDRLVYRRNRVKKNVNLLKKKWFSPSKPAPISWDPVITWIGHATFLIQLGGYNILTDPIFGNIGFGFNRTFPPGIDFENLPKIDFVLLSHNHRDHADLNSIKKLEKKYSPTFLVPLGLKGWLRKNGVKLIREFNWWDGRNLFKNIKNSLKIYFLPAYHWSGWSFFDVNRSLWGGWLVEWNSFKIYFAGDTAYNADLFDEIAARFSNISVALLPIAPNEPKKLVSKSHLSTEEACNVFLKLNASYFVPMHWGTFVQLSFDFFDAPIEVLKNWWQKNLSLLSEKYLIIPRFGEQLHWKLVGVEKRIDKVITSFVISDRNVW